MATKTATKYSTLKKLAKTKDQLSVNTSWVKVSQLEDKLYKQLKELAKEMIDSVQYVINHKGAYENAGVDEEREFEGLIDNYGVRWNYQQRCNLKDYIIGLVDNLKY